MSSPAAVRKAVQGKTVVITGASDGIGARLSVRLAEQGAKVVLVARTPEKLTVVGDQIRSAGHEAVEYPADLSNDEDCQRAVEQIMSDLGHIDIFVSNAGRSIRRSAKYQGGEKFHDFHRLMELNYFGALRMILGILPSMTERRCGHIVHVSSFGVPTRQPRFSGYVASKSALDQALQSIAGEVADAGVATSTVYMPLVQTKMVESKGHSYDHLSLLSVDMACEFIEYAIISRDSTVIDGPSRFLQVLYFFRPTIIIALNNLIYRLEAEHAPDGMARDRSRAAMALKHKKNKGGGFSPLKFLGGLLAFFANLEFMLMRLGIAGILRDPVIIIIASLVFIAEPFVRLGFFLNGMMPKKELPKSDASKEDVAGDEDDKKED